MPLLSRDPFAVIDIGSNSVRLVLYDGLQRTPVSFFNEKVLCGLGRDLDKSGDLAPEATERALSALGRFNIICEQFEIPEARIRCVATSAVRDAANRSEFVKRVEILLGVKVDVLSGEEEAQFAAQGVLAGDPKLDGWVADLGGGSLELARVRAGQISQMVSFPFGALRLGQTRQSEAEAELAETFAKYLSPEANGRLYIVGGAWRAFARLYMSAQDYPLKILHHFEAPTPSFMDFAILMSQQSATNLGALEDISTARAQTIPYASLVLRELIKALTPSSIAVSTHGLREGVLQQELSADELKMDPVEIGVAALEQQFQLDFQMSEEVMDFFEPLTAHFTDRFQHLYRSIFRLSNLAWRDHPNYRRANILHTVLYSPIDGLSHEERIFMALSLYHRYGGEKSVDAKPLEKCLTRQDLADAKCLGAYLRFVHTFSGRVPGILSHCALRMDARHIVLNISPKYQGLVGEIVDMRLGALAGMMDKSSRIEITASLR